MITRVIKAILHGYVYRCALRFWLGLWCALGKKSLKTTALESTEMMVQKTKVYQKPAFLLWHLFIFSVFIHAFMVLCLFCVYLLLLFFPCRSQHPCTCSMLLFIFRLLVFSCLLKKNVSFPIAI